VTSSGGTTTPWSGVLQSTSASAAVSVSSERAWASDYLWSPIAAVTGTSEATVAGTYPVGGGGGYSTVEPRPPYQQGVSGVSRFNAVRYLTPTTYQTVTGITVPTQWSFNPSPWITTGWGSGRAEPDVSADADPYSGYLLYEPSAPGGTTLQAGWGGTSFVAP